MRKFTDEEIKALNIVKGMFSEEASFSEWPNECPTAEGDQSVGATLEYAVHLIDDLFKAQKDVALKDKVSATLLSQDYTDKCKEIQRLYAPLSNKLAEYNLELALDTRGDYSLVIIPDGLFFGNGNGKDYDHGISSDFLLDNCIDLDESKNDLVTVLDGKEKILSYETK